MTANATLDITQVLPANSRENVNKTHSSGADDFENVFENVSQNYDDKSTDKPVNNANDNINTKKSSDGNTENNSEVKEKSSEHNSSGKTDVKIATNDEEKTSTDTVDSAKPNTENTELSSLQERIADMVQKITQQLNDIQTGANVDVQDLSDNLSDLDSMIKDFAKQLKADSSKDEALDSVETGASQVITNAQNVLADLQQSILNSQNLNIFTADAQSVLARQLKSITADLDKLVKDSGDSENLIQSANLKIQTQAQVGSKEKVQAVVTPSQNEIEVPQTAIVESPVIKASIANVQADINASDLSKQEVKDALSKSSLTQEMIDKTDAKVVKVETTSSGSSDSGFLNNQNAQEQAVKLSLQADAMLGQTSAQAGFDKISQSVQVQTQQNAGGSSEISQSEILSQVNSKLANFKSDESTKVTIILKPENLGKINLELVSNKEGLSAHFTAETAQVKEALDKNLDSLKESLSSQGVNVNNVTVKVAETQKQDNAFSFDSQTEQNKQQQENSKTAGEHTAKNSEEEIGDENIDIQESVMPEEKSVSISSHLGQIDYKI